MRERRFKKARQPKRIFLVLCEGETEEEYVNMLKRHYRLPIAIKTKVSGNAVSSRLVNQYMKELGLVKEDECRVFYIYDADIECIAEKLLKMPGTTILSNPSIELWYLLHARANRRYIASDSMVRELSACHSVWRPYLKGRLSMDQQEFLLSNQESAIKRTDKLDWPANPSSNMSLFIKALEAELR